jgi:hypothetical protein
MNVVTRLLSITGVISLLTRPQHTDALSAERHENISGIPLRTFKKFYAPNAHSPLLRRAPLLI